jgi:LuxR family maltose regulon positive regulatory protein
MEQLILNTKIEITPLRGDSVMRKRLINLINENSDQKVILISAAAGFGKTTLLSQWVSIDKNPIVWFSIDENDNDASCFFTYVIRALQQWKPTLGKTALNLLQVPQSPPIESVLILLLNEIQKEKSDITLILDDYHLISSPKINQLMIFLIDHQPQNMHLIISSRSDPNLPIARWRSQNQLVEIREADLSFTNEESDSLFNKTLGLGLSADDIDRLESRTEGWVTGLQLAALSLKGYKDREGFIKQFHGNNRYVVDYLLEEVFNQQSKDIQLFLLYTAVLDQLSGQLCDTIMGSQNSSDLLEILEKQNMFIFPIDVSRQWYRYHQLFKDVLSQRLLHLPGVEKKLIELNQKAGEWYTSHGFNDEAIDHFLNAEKYERATILLEITAEIKWLCGQQIKLLGWFERFPSEYISQHPHLAIFFARELFMNGRREEAEEVLSRAEQNLVTLENKRVKTVSGLLLTDEELRGRILVVRAVMSSYRGNFTGVILYAGEAMELLNIEDLRWRNIASITYALANSWAGFGNFTAAKKAFQEAQNSSEKIEDVYLYIFCGICIAAAEMLQGECKKALETYTALLLEAEKKGMTNSGIVGAIYAALGSIYCELNEVEKGISFLDKGIRLAEQGHDLLMLASARLNQLRFFFYTNAYTKAMKLVDEMESLPEAKFYPPWMKHVLSAIRPWLWIKMDNPEPAVKWAEKLGFPEKNDISMRREIEYVVLARILIEQKQREKASELIGNLMIDAEKGNRFLRITELHILKTINLYYQDDIRGAVNELYAALIFGEPRGLFMTFVHEGEPVAELIDVILTEKKESKTNIYPDISVKYLENLIQVIREGICKQGKQLLEEPLSQREQEVLAYIAAGLSNKQIADSLFVSLNTIRTHTKKINSKLGVHSRTQAIAKAKDLGLIQ